MQSLQEDFDATRMSALKEYGMLEWDLSSLFQLLLGTTADKAKLIFYRIVNTRARYGIIDDLISIGHPQCKPFWSRLETLLQGADTKRNHVTHWIHMLDQAADAAKPQFNLENPVSLLRSVPGAMRYGLDDLRAFERECKQLGHVVQLFRDFLRHPNDERLPQALTEIFLRPPENPKQGEFRRVLFDAVRLAPRPPLRV